MSDTPPTSPTDLIAPSMTLTVLSRPRFDAGAACDFLALSDLEWRRDPTATDAESLVEFAGRLCYLSFGARQSSRTNAEYVRNLIDQGHESVLEHATWSFVLRGVSRAFTHQLVRHRVGVAFSQLSQQYADQTDVPYVLPSRIAADPNSRDRWLRAVDDARALYERIQADLEATEELVGKEGQRRSRTAARSVLPEAAETQLVFSANARALRHILEVRGQLEGDEEMRQFAAQLFAVLEDDAPSFVSDFAVGILPDGSPIVRPISRHR